MNFKIIPHTERENWNKIVKSFPDWDIYYLCEYSISFKEHGDGDPFLVYFENNKSRLYYVIMLNDIAKIKQFNGQLPYGKFYDITTPYGYGGPIVDGEFTEEDEILFYERLSDYCIANNIVTQFFRFHPIYQNQVYVKHTCEISNIKDTIAIDTSSQEIIDSNMDSKNRNMVRKAIKNGVTIIQDNGENFDEFKRIYELTMDGHQARKYYYFSKDYYEYIKKNMKDNTIFFYSIYENKIIGGSIFFYNENYMHYHLSGVLFEYRNLASSNLLLYEAALWATKRRIKSLHLGGGVGLTDSLFKFKQQFNKNGNLPFWIGRNLFDKEKYDYLLKKRQDLDSTFDTENVNFIQYRKE